MIDKKPNCQSVSFNSDLKDWLKDQAQEHELKYLLAHADDGVIWGKFRDNQLATSQDAFPELAQLRLCTLQQCRIFGEKAEVRLWKANQNWKMCVITDNNHLDKLEPDECQILWGTQEEKRDNQLEFTLVSDGSQGLKHAVPLINIPFKEDKKSLERPIRLRVRHYIHYDDSGLVRIALSRLVDLCYVKNWR